jgi:beta-lactamase class D
MSKFQTQSLVKGFLEHVCCKKIPLYATCCMTLSGFGNPVFGSQAWITLVNQDKQRTITQEGDCKKRFAPCSTFKIPLALMGYNSGFLKDEGTPTWPFQEGYVDFLPQWKQDQTPTSWIKNSCVWFSHVLTQKLGMEKFQDYVTQFSYGNQDLSGDKGENNGLTQSWLSSSLLISPEEQILFLEKLTNHTLPVSPSAHTLTKNILFVEALKNGWKLYGKTGSGKLLDEQGKRTNIQHGWFIGWIEKDKHVVLFAHHIADEKEEDNWASLRAKEGAKKKLFSIIDSIDV